MNIIDTIAKELGQASNHVRNVLRLLDDGATIPFIARYRKEMTGAMDEVVVARIRDMKKRHDDLDDRKKAILSSLEERDLLTPQLKTQVRAAATLSSLEDVYEQYRPKKKTRALMAKEKGLTQLAGILMQQDNRDPKKAALTFIDPEKQVHSAEEALAGARDIIAEAISENAANRTVIRKLFRQTAQIISRVKKGKEKEAIKYKDYFDWQEPAFKAPSHRVLAMFRGKNESVLTLKLLPDEKEALTLLSRKYVKNNSAGSRQVMAAVEDGYQRLLSKSIETQCFKTIKEQADIKAVQVFADNTKALLLAAPMGQKRLLAIDPGFRTGCKVVCLDRQGKLLHHDVIYPHGKDDRAAAQKIKGMVDQYRVEAIAVGNGTAGRETQRFLGQIGLDSAIPVVMVDESGASVYSASKTAREEFPDFDITVRGAVSIGRRLMDPLAELVKIDPKSIGVGQYQHDVDAKLLETALNDVVTFCVNQVGVEANTASVELLSRVAGLTSVTARNMVKYRDDNGPFKNRKDFLKVQRLGPKAFEQAAGFLRIRNSDQPLDNSGIHPESYKIVKKMAKDAKISVEKLIRNKDCLEKINLEQYATEDTGLPTLKDIKAELLNPGRDPREKFENVRFDENVHAITDLVAGMHLTGIVTNVTAFGAFVDIGVHQDGLVHISQMADRFVKDPGEIVTVRQKVSVTVLEVDVDRKRISLSMKQN